ncbi:hypothetical protein BVI434_960006 [Burkholderia vietnamiensis]|nr:hypothetical protein BVI434_960006 [Burkholderia vietnamiensis]
MLRASVPRFGCGASRRVTRMSAIAIAIAADRFPRRSLPPLQSERPRSCATERPHPPPRVLAKLPRRASSRSHKRFR